MSEREVRECAWHVGWCPIDEEDIGCECGLSEALSAEPDVVAVLRWLEKGIEQCRKPPSLSNLPVDSKQQDYWKARADGYEAAKNHIVSECHIRLTDDGWEWIEEA